MHLTFTSVIYVCCYVAVLCLSVSDSLHELVTNLPESEMPEHFYMDRRFALVLLCFFLILPLSISKEISIQKYIRSGVTCGGTYSSHYYFLN